MNNSVKGAFLATTIAGLFLGAGACAKSSTTKTNTNPTPPPEATAEKVECWGVNDCKGTGECGSAVHQTSCAGTNECKGKGWISLAKADCLDRGGRVTEK